MSVSLYKYERGQKRTISIGNYHGTVVVPEIPGGKSDEPLDLGELTLHVYNVPEVGESAPLFEATTAKGETFKLADQKGKYVFLSFRPILNDIEREKLNDFYRSYGDKVLVVALCRGKSATQFERTFEADPTPWPQIFVPEDSQLAKDYDTPGLGYTFLIGPDGKILADGLRESGFEEARKALEKAGITATKSHESTESSKD